MIAYDTLVGEFRVHYAGFFDPGFGYAPANGEGSRAVLEIRSHDVPFILEDGQVVGRLLYERLTAKPDKLYGRDIGSSYQRQALGDGDVEGVVEDHADGVRLDLLVLVELVADIDVEAEVEGVAG